MFVETLGMVVPYLDTRCRAVLSVVSRVIREAYLEQLRRHPDETLQSIIQRGVETLLQKSKLDACSPYIVPKVPIRIYATPRGTLFDVVYAIRQHMWSKHGLILRYSFNSAYAEHLLEHVGPTMEAKYPAYYRGKRLTLPIWFSAARLDSPDTLAIHNPNTCAWLAYQEVDSGLAGNNLVSRTRFDFQLKVIDISVPPGRAYLGYFPRCILKGVTPYIAALWQTHQDIDLVWKVDSLTANRPCGEFKQLEADLRPIVGPKTVFLTGSTLPFLLAYTTRGIVIIVRDLISDDTPLISYLQSIFEFSGRPSLRIYVVANTARIAKAIHKTAVPNYVRLRLQEEDAGSELLMTALLNCHRQTYTELVTHDSYAFSLRLHTVPAYNIADRYDPKVQTLQQHRNYCVTLVKRCDKPNEPSTIELRLQKNRTHGCFNIHLKNSVRTADWVRTYSREFEEVLVRVEAEFETVFWRLTGNHWQDYPEHFMARVGLYTPTTEASISSTPPARRDASPKRRPAVVSN